MEKEYKLSKAETVSSKPARDSNIELLRILTMLGVIVLHYNNADLGGGLKHVAVGSTNYMILLSAESLFICAVDLFILITGYFTCTAQRIHPSKAIALLLQVSVFRGLYYGWEVLHGTVFSLKKLLVALIPSNWFVALYIAMYLLSPYINLLLKKLSLKATQGLVILCFLLFSLWPTVSLVMERVIGVSMNGTSPISIDGSGMGYTLVNFLLMYLIGAYIRIANITLKKRHSASVVVVCAVSITLVSLYSTALAWCYCNPLVILEAVFVFLLFRQMQFRCKLVNILAKGAFVCFLLHMRFFPLFHIPYAVQKSPLYLLGHIIFTSTIIYFISFAIHLIYDYLSRPILRFIEFFLKLLKIDQITIPE